MVALLGRFDVMVATKKLKKIENKYKIPLDLDLAKGYIEANYFKLNNLNIY
jgi:hypothetical protein